IARAIGQMLDHLQAVDGRLEGMCDALGRLGSDYCAKDLPELRNEVFDCVKDAREDTVG
ncbi:serine O-acetyltransferase, partial [Pseudomonas syringae pv. actinidiae ICMP 18804]